MQRIYAERCELAVVCVSERYGSKPWTLAEHDAIRGRVNQARAAAEERDRLGVLLIRVGDGEVNGITFNAIVPDVRKKSLAEAADLIINRLALLDIKVGLGPSIGAASHAAGLAPSTLGVEKGAAGKRNDGAIDAEQSARIQSLRPKIKSCLSQSSDACRFLSEVLDTQDASESILTEALLRINHPDDLAQKIRDAFDKARHEKNGLAAKVFKDLVLLLLPMRFAHDVVQVIRVYRGDQKQAVIAPDVCTRMGAEFAMAAADGLPADFPVVQLIDNQGYSLDPEGVFSLGHPPTMGMECAGGANDQQFKRAWYEHLFNKVEIRTDDQARIPLSGLLRTVNRRLKSNSGRNRYVLLDFRSGSSTEDQEVWGRRAQLLREDCPSLVFLKLSDNPDSWDREMNLLDMISIVLADFPEDTP